MNHPRFLKKKILNSLKISPVVLLTGGRQTGKNNIDQRDCEGLIQLQSEAKELFIRGIILYPGSEIIRYKEKFIAIPN